MIAVWSEKAINEYDWIESTQLRNKNTAVSCYPFFQKKELEKKR